VGGDAPRRRTDISFLPATKKGKGATMNNNNNNNPLVSFILESVESFTY
jgi:hypothetical protein